MSEWWPMLLFLSGLFGTSLLVLICGAVNLRAESTSEATEDSPSITFDLFPPQRTRPGPESRIRFDAPVQGNGHLEAALQEFLAREARVAEEFVSEPSLERLYSDAQRPIAPRDLTRFVERELQFAANFAAEPSVESLYRRSERCAWIN